MGYMINEKGIIKTCESEIMKITNQLSKFGRVWKLKPPHVG